MEKDYTQKPSYVFICKTSIIELQNIMVATVDIEEMIKVFFRAAATEINKQKNKQKDTLFNRLMRKKWFRILIRKQSLSLYEPLIEDAISEKEMEELTIEVNRRLSNYIVVSVKNIKDTRECKIWFKKSVEKYAQWQAMRYIGWM